MTGMTCTSAIVLGDTRKAWVDDACGNTWSGKCVTSNGCATRQKHGGHSALGLITANTN